MRNARQTSRHQSDYDSYFTSVNVSTVAFRERGTKKKSSGYRLTFSNTLQQFPAIFQLLWQHKGDLLIDQLCWVGSFLPKQQYSDLIGTSRRTDKTTFCRVPKTYFNLLECHRQPRSNTLRNVKFTVNISHFASFFLFYDHSMMSNII